MKKRSVTLLSVLGATLAVSAGQGQAQGQGQTSPTPTATAVQAPQAPATPVPSPAAASPTAVASTPAPAAAPTLAPTPTPTSVPRRAAEPPPSRIVDPPSVPVGVLPPENPFGATLEAPPALPAKPPLQDTTLTAALFVEVKLDATGKPVTVRRARDPIPSLAAETQKDMARWTFEPAQRGGQNVETWTPLRLDLQVEVDAPRIDQAQLIPITPTTPLPAPLDWGNDDAWYQALKGAPPSDGTVPVTEVDRAAAPKRTPFPDSYRGPFSARFWVRVSPAGKIDRVLPIAASDPILLSYFRRFLPTWTLRPARKAGAPAESWNDLNLSGQVSYSVEIKQIGQLRKPLASS